VCACVHVSANANFPTIANMLVSRVPAPHPSGVPNSTDKKGYCPECLRALVAPESKTVLKTSTSVNSFVPSEGYVLFHTRFASLMNNTILPVSLLTFLHCKFSPKMKTSFVSCGLIRDSRAMSRFTCENIFPPLTFFTSSSQLFF